MELLLLQLRPRSLRDLSATLVQFFGTDGEFLASREELDLSGQLREAQQQDLLNRLCHFIGKTPVGDKADSEAQPAFSSCVQELAEQKEGESSVLVKNYQELTTLIEGAFFSKKKLSNAEAKEVLRSIQEKFVSLL